MADYLEDLKDVVKVNATVDHLVDRLEIQTVPSKDEHSVAYSVDYWDSLKVLPLADVMDGRWELPMVRWLAVEKVMHWVHFAADESGSSTVEVWVRPMDIH